MRTRRQHSGSVTTKLGNLISIDQGVLIQNSPIYAAPYVPSMKVTSDELHKNYPYSGGPFSSSHTSVSYTDGYCKMGSDGNGSIYPHPLTAYYYEGRLRVAGGAAPTLLPDQQSATASYGSRAWNKFKPGKPVVSLGQTLAELRDTPHAVKRMLMSFKQAYKSRRRSVNPGPLSTGGGAYLAWSFGWKPFLKDLTDWMDSIQKLDSQIAQLRRDNGKRIRRGGKLFSTTNSSTVNTGLATYGGLAGYYSVLFAKRETIETEKVWFRGSFRYYIPGLDDPKWGRLRAIRRLWGLEMTPDLVYELMPWSWLVDWFADVGSLVSNLTSQINDNLVADYAYLMRSTEKKVTSDLGILATLWIGYMSAGTYGVRVERKPCFSTCVYTQTTKTRVAASPFGFGLDLSALSPYQISILSALGLSRLRF